MLDVAEPDAAAHVRVAVGELADRSRRGSVSS